MGPVALSEIAPEVLAVRLVVEARLIAPPETREMAGVAALRATLVAIRLPPITRSFAPKVARRIVPLAVNAATLKAPRLRVRSRLPLGLKVPPVWLKSEVTVMLPLPPRLPADRFTTGAVSEPLMVTPAPAMPNEVPAVRFMAPVTSSDPAESCRFSSESRLSTLNAPPLMVMVCEPGTLMRTLCPAVGAAPLLQLAPTDQSPLPPIQQSSTAQPEAIVKVAVVAP